MHRMDALPQIVTEHLDEVRALCEKYSVKRLTIFGSAVKGTFDPEKSDLDFAVELFPHVDPVVEGRKYLELWDALESLFGRSVDLVSLAEIRNPYVAASIRRNQLQLYVAA
jgi:predicted nucleotidyltransferase